MVSMIKKHSLQVGLSFGSTSGIITTLGLMVGLQAGTNSRIVVIGGILMIAVADALSDSLGIHISEESEKIHTPQEIWLSTFYTFLFKFLFSSLFIIPVLLFSLGTAIIVSIVAGILLLGIMSFYFAKGQGISPLEVVREHIIIAVIAIIFTHYIGVWINNIFH